MLGSVLYEVVTSLMETPHCVPDGRPASKKVIFSRLLLNFTGIARLFPETFNLPELGVG